MYFTVARPYLSVKQNVMNEFIKDTFNLIHTFRLGNNNACHSFRTDARGIVAGYLNPITYIAGHFKR
jgi:hypothetical protein